MTATQLAFSFDLDALRAAVEHRLADDLADRRNLDRANGAQRLLRALVRQGLAREHLPAAAALVLTLDAGITQRSPTTYGAPATLRGRAQRLHPTEGCRG